MDANARAHSVPETHSLLSVRALRIFAFPTVKLTESRPQQGPEKLIWGSDVVRVRGAKIRTSSSFQFRLPFESTTREILSQQTSGVLKVRREFFSHVANGFTGAWSQCFSEALRGLQVVCYGGCLGSGDKAAGRLSQVQQTLPGSGEVASRARQSGTSVSDTTCHRLFPVDNWNRKSQTKK